MRITRRGLLWGALVTLARPRGASAAAKPTVTVHRSPT
jgi:hypothetical protein